jgi:hypothetical protein
MRETDVETTKETAPSAELGTPCIGGCGRRVPGAAMCPKSRGDYICPDCCGCGWRAPEPPRRAW